MDNLEIRRRYLATVESLRDELMNPDNELACPDDEWWIDPLDRDAADAKLLQMTLDGVGVSPLRLTRFLEGDDDQLNGHELASLEQFTREAFV